MVFLRDHLISIQVSCQAEGRAGLGENQFRHQTMEAEQVVPVHSEDLRKSEASWAGAIAFRHPYLLLQSHRNQMQGEEECIGPVSSESSVSWSSSANESPTGGREGGKEGGGAFILHRFSERDRRCGGDFDVTLHYVFALKI